MKVSGKSSLDKVAREDFLKQKLKEVERTDMRRSSEGEVRVGSYGSDKRAEAFVWLEACPGPRN